MSGSADAVKSRDAPVGAMRRKPNRSVIRIRLDFKYDHLRNLPYVTPRSVAYLNVGNDLRIGDLDDLP
jgi:hypothetical protein